MTRIVSSKYRNGARGQQCTLRIPGCCTGDTETTVFAHIRDRHTGRSIKASDISGADACFACHARFDGQDGHPLSREEWLFYALRGLQETLERRKEQGILFVPEDAPKQRKTRPRLPPDQRKKIHSRSDWPKGRKIPNRKPENVT